jgi:hypothetical protein
MSIIQPTLTIDQENQISAYVNAYRAKNQANPLVWDNTIYTFSQNWASYLTTNNLFQHSGNKNYGENLAYFQGYAIDPVALIKKSIDSWYNEISQYNFASPGFTQATGHFTCLVWKSSINFAIGIGINPETQTAFITMNTFPAGNMQGEFATNVLSTVVSPPVPVPVPVPVPSPIPTNMNVNVSSAIYNIIYMYEHNQNRSAMLFAINNIITQYSQYMNANTINQLQNLTYLINSRVPRMVFIHAINAILQTLQ